MCVALSIGIVDGSEDSWYCSLGRIRRQEKQERSGSNGLQDCKDECGTRSNGTARNGTCLRSGNQLVYRSIDKVVPRVAGIVAEEASSEEEKAGAGNLCSGDADGVRGVHHAE